MRFVIRADAFKRTGSGHVTRSIAVAEELLSRGLCVVFIGNTLEIPWVTELVSSTGFSEVHDSDLGFFPNQQTDILILDSYEIPKDTFFINRNNWLKRVLLVDSHTPLYGAEVHVQISLSSFEAYEDGEILKVGGPEFFPLRQGIRLERRSKQPSNIPHILLTTGGNEVVDLVDKFISALAAVDVEFSAEVLSNRTLQSRDSRFKISKIGSDYTKKLKNADMVISSSGVSSVEIAANRIPMALFSAFDNQRENYSLLTSSGYAIGIGEFDKNGGRVEIGALSRFLESFSSVNRPTEFQGPNLDFNGSKRIVDLILSLQ